jgi:tRNA threonylcarbamoyladenosine biosynthesis protein TsaE
MRRVRTSSAAETEALGAEVAAGLVLGDVVLVEGEMGAGKTTFVRGAARALGVNGPVTSPTFTVGQRYRGKVAVAHLDLFRIDHVDAEEPGFLGDYLGPDAIGFIEWPGDPGDEILSLARVAAHVRIAHAGGDRRIVEIE